MGDFLGAFSGVFLGDFGGAFLGVFLGECGVAFLGAFLGDFLGDFLGVTFDVGGFSWSEESSGAFSAVWSTSVFFVDLNLNLGP